MSSSEAESSSSEPIVVATKKSKTKTKQKSKPTGVVITPHGKNEAPKEDTGYEPPKGSVLFDHSGEFGEFDWDSVKDEEDVELWLIRVPDAVRPKHIENLRIEQPSSSRNVRVGQLERKNTKYDVWSLAESQEDAEDDIHVGGEELKGLSCLLPRKWKGGKLYLTSKPITKHLVVSASPVIPTTDTNAGPTLNQNPPRHSYSKDLFKHKFTPYGSKAVTGGADVEMADGEVAASSPTEKKKKRSRDVDPPKKVKKVKASKS